MRSAVSLAEECKKGKAVFSDRLSTFVDPEGIEPSSKQGITLLSSSLVPT